RKKMYSDILPQFAHCLTKIFLCPLQASLFLQFCSGLSFWAAASLISSKAGEADGIRERERGRFFMRQTRGGVCRLHKQIARYASPEERRVEKSLSYQARREVLQQVAAQYGEASSSQKRTLLDAFDAPTGSHLTYPSWLLNH